MKCRLCLKDRDLLKRSHIIPDFMYQELYDEKHKIIKLSPKNPANFVKIPTGEYDSNILCEACDNGIIGKLEDYGSKVLYGSTLPIDQQPKFSAYCNEQGVEYTFVENIRYTDFKLFLLSILWRAGISNRKFFENISLGPYEEELRLMILKKDAKDIEAFPCIILSMRNDVDWAKEVHVQPVCKKESLGNRYSFVISGTVYMFYAPSYYGPEELRGFYINKTNETRILHTPDGEGEKYIKTMLGLIS